MTTEKRAAHSAPLEDLRSAIASTAFVQAKDGATIIASERSGARDSWIFDFRALMLQPRWLDKYAELFWERYASHLPFQVGGMETAGIALVSAIVMKGVQRGTPVNGFYVRKSRKRQGLMKFVEGTLTDEPVILVDDLINSGQSIDKQLAILEKAGKRVTDVFAILAFRADDAYDSFAQKGVTLAHLFTLADFGLPLVRDKGPEVPKESFDVLWQYQAPEPSFHLVVQKSAPALDETRVFFGCDDGVFRALDQETGALAWEFKTGRHPQGKGILSSPLVHEGRVYFGAYDGSVYALDAKSGKKIWSYDEADWIGSSPALAPELGLLYIGLEFGLVKKRGGIAAIDIRTGKQKWLGYHAGLTHGSPLYIKEESLVVIGSNDGYLYAYDAATGAPRWRFASRGEIKTRPAYDAKRRTVVFGTDNGIFYALAAHDGTPLHAREMGISMYSIPLIENDTIYGAFLDKCLYAIDAGTWKDRWVFETSGRIFASPVIANGSLWIGSNDGRLYELDPQSGAQKAFFQAPERIVNMIAARGERLFVPTVAQELYCIQKKKAE